MKMRKTYVEKCERKYTNPGVRRPSFSFYKLMLWYYQDSSVIPDNKFLLALILKSKK